jgi:hypothetical protein
MASLLLLLSALLLPVACPALVPQLPLLRVRLLLLLLLQQAAVVLPQLALVGWRGWG